MDKEKLIKAEQWWKEKTATDYKLMGINEKDIIGMYENKVDKEATPCKNATPATTE